MILTLSNQVLLVINNTNIMLGQILDRLISHFPKLLRNLTDETYKKKKKKINKKKTSTI